MPIKIRVGKTKYNRGIGWISKMINSNKEGEFEAYRCVPSIYNNYYLSAEDYGGYLEVEYVYKRKYFWLHFLDHLKQMFFFLEFDESLFGTCVLGMILLILAKQLSK